MESLVDNQSTLTETDNQGDLAQSSVNELTQQEQTTGNQEQVAATQQQQVQNPYKPFASGKEKFKVNGKDEEWDWETTRKYASLGKTSYQKMQEAAEVKKRAEDAYSQLLDLAKKDPEGLLRALNPNYAPQSQQQRQDQVTDADPRDLKIQELERKLGEFSSVLEQQQVEEERKLINKELDDAVTKYTVLKGDKFALNYVKSEYRKALMQGLDVSIDDVAFHVSQELQELRNQKVQETQKRFEQKRKNAPVTAVSTGSESSSKPMSLDEVKRLAGRF